MIKYRQIHPADLLYNPEILFGSVWFVFRHSYRIEFVYTDGAIKSFRYQVCNIRAVLLNQTPVTCHVVVLGIPYVTCQMFPIDGDCIRRLLDILMPMIQ
jgi:hypothetical protein